MGQIQQSITTAVGSVGLGKVANTKVAELSAQKADLEEYMELNSGLIEDQTQEIFSLERNVKKLEESNKVMSSQLKAKKVQESSKQRRLTTKKRGK